MQDYALKKALFELVKLNARSRNGYTLLHLACTKDSATLSRYPICTFPSTDVINLLLQVGADPDSVDQVLFVDSLPPESFIGLNRDFYLFICLFFS